ncbi:phage tail spike protein [Bacillus pacificus]|uniref:phage tail spike protein n=1 Tax=Bacillus pacificus TaxID=2026187 RepID=UPI000BFCAE7E|nr:endopeptidase [Bacillus anthracis]
MITLYKPTETDFTHNGIGVLDDNIYDPVIEEELNGLYVLSFKYPLFAPHGLEIDGQCLIKAPTPDGDQLFRVANHAPSMGELNVFCYHVFYDLVDNLIEDTFIQDKNGQSALQQISERLQYKTKFTFSSDISKVASSRLVQKNPVEAILDSNQENSFVSRWGGELKRDNFNVNMMQQRGKDRGVVIQHKKDLLGYEADVDWQSPITKIMPKGFDGLLLPEKYINSYFIRNYINPKIRVVEFEHIKAAIGDYVDDEDAVPLEEAYKMLRDAAQAMYDVQKVDQPKATYKVEFQELSQTEEYKDFAVLQRVYMGDTVTVEHEEDNIDVQAKVISYKYDPIKKEYIEITLGNFKESFTNAFGKIDQMQDEINKVSEMPNSILNAAKENATKLINSGFGGNVRIYPERILIMDTKDEMTAKKVWQWNINGFGYSSTGINGPYNTAITMDGRIVADFITTGTLSGNLIRGGLITGTTLRTDSSSNYVSIDKQFIRLMESNLNRMFLGYYWNKDGRIQPTILLHENIDTSRFSDGTLVIAQQNLGSYYTGSIGVAKGETTPGDTYYPSKLNLNSNGNTLLFGDNKTTIEGQNGIDFRSFKQASTYANSIRLDASGNMDILSGDRLFIRGTNAIEFNTRGYVLFNSQVSTSGVNVGGFLPDSSGTIKYMNGYKGWNYYGNIGDGRWVVFNWST